MTHTNTDQAPLANFAANTEAYRKRLKESDEAITLTADGQPELVVLSVKAFQELVERANGNLEGEGEEDREGSWEELAEDERQRIQAEALDPAHLATLRRGLEEVKEGKGKPFEQFMQEMTEKHGLPSHKP